MIYPFLSICPVCDAKLKVSDYTKFIYNCKKKHILKEHYSCHISNIKGALVISQEDFIFKHFDIIKHYPSYGESDFAYFIGSNYQPPGKYRWYLTFNKKQFDDLFPNFNPKEYDVILNKLEILDTFQ